MDLAKSMYLWGSCIEPHECDYEDSRDLGLTCIYCDRPVYLVKGCIRTSRKGKSFEVKPHFSHYQKSSESEQCELRHVTPEGQALKEFAVGVGRGQRLSLYEEYLFSLIKRSILFLIPQNCELNKKSRKAVGSTFSDCQKYFSGIAEEKKELPAFVHDLYTWFCEDKDRIVETGLEIAKYDSELSSLVQSSTMESRIIFHEILNHIASDKTGQLLLEFAILSEAYIATVEIFDKATREFISNWEDATPFGFVYLAIRCLSLAPWDELVDLYLDPKKKKNILRVKSKGFGDKPCTQKLKKK